MYDHQAGERVAFIRSVFCWFCGYNHRPALKDHASALYGGREKGKQKSCSAPHHEGKTTRHSPAHERYVRIDAIQRAR
jgi:hypothetical protein